MVDLAENHSFPTVPDSQVITGFPAWFLWRTYYLSRLPGFDRKVRVALDWLLGLIFPRDIAELRVYTQRASRGAARDAGLDPGSDLPAETTTG